jgi:hypothetical protein
VYWWVCIHAELVLGICKVFMSSFIVVRFALFVVIFHVVFGVLLLVEVRLRDSLSALGQHISEPLSLTLFSPLFLVFP